MSLDQRRSRVFVVDDEPVIASTLAAILRIEGFECKSFTRPVEALFAAKCETPDLLITDVVMPGMSGIELALEFERDFQDCKVLLFSGTTSSAKMVEDTRAFGREFDLLHKPVHPRELVQIVRDLLNTSTAHSSFSRCE